MLGKEIRGKEKKSRASKTQREVKSKLRAILLMPLYVTYSINNHKRLIAVCTAINSLAL
jgi:hypothetical protein